MAGQNHAVGWRKIKMTVPAGDEHNHIDTGGMESLSAEAAIEVAKALIDGGGMN